MSYARRACDDFATLAPHASPRTGVPSLGRRARGRFTRRLRLAAGAADPRRDLAPKRRPARSHRRTRQADKRRRLDERAARARRQPGRGGRDRDRRRPPACRADLPRLQPTGGGRARFRVADRDRHAPLRLRARPDARAACRPRPRPRAGRGPARGRHTPEPGCDRRGNALDRARRQRHAHARERGHAHQAAPAGERRRRRARRHPRGRPRAALGLRRLPWIRCRRLFSRPRRRSAANLSPGGRARAACRARARPPGLPDRGRSARRAPPAARADRTAGGSAARAGRRRGDQRLRRLAGRNAAAGARPRRRPGRVDAHVGAARRARRRVRVGGPLDVSPSFRRAPAVVLFVVVLASAPAARAGGDFVDLAVQGARVWFVGPSGVRSLDARNGRTLSTPHLVGAAYPLSVTLAGGAAWVASVENGYVWGTLSRIDLRTHRVRVLWRKQDSSVQYVAAGAGGVWVLIGSASGNKIARFSLAGQMKRVWKVADAGRMAADASGCWISTNHWLLHIDAAGRVHRVLQAQLGDVSTGAGAVWLPQATTVLRTPCDEPCSSMSPDPRIAPLIRSSITIALALAFAASADSREPRQRGHRSLRLPIRNCSPS